MYVEPSTSRGMSTANIPTMLLYPKTTKDGSNFHFLGGGFVTESAKVITNF